MKSPSRQQCIPFTPGPATWYRVGCHGERTVLRLCRSQRSNVKPVRCRREVKDSDFARIMPKLVAHLQRVDYSAQSTDPTVPPADFLPQPLLDEHDLMPWLEALAVVHAELGTPLPAGARTRARRRLVFNEAVLLSIMMLHHRVALQSAEHAVAEAPVVCDNQVRPPSQPLPPPCPTHLVAQSGLGLRQSMPASRALQSATTP